MGERVAERARGVLHGAHEQVVQPLVVLERRLGERLTAAPSADKMEQSVDPAEALLDRRPPVAGRGFVEQVHGPGVEARGVKAELRSERLDPLRGYVREAEHGARARQPPDNRRPEASACAGDRNHAAAEVELLVCAHAAARWLSLGRLSAGRSLPWSWT